MWSNYLKIALRNLMRYRGSSFVNIFGLSMGLACCTLCYLHINYELGYDKIHTNRDRIYRIVVGDRSGSEYWVKMSPPVPPLLQQRIPEIEKFARFNSVSYSPKVVVEVEGRFFSEGYFMMADPAFLQMFSLPILAGQPETALSDLNSVVVTESTARKLFGDEDPIGKIIKLKDNNIDFQVSAVAADIPGQSHFTFDYLVSFENLDRIYGAGHMLSWGQYNYFNYFLLSPGADPAAVEEKIHKIGIPYYDGSERMLDQLFLQPLSDIHFQYNRGNMLPSYDKKYIYIFGAVAIALLTIACINYINLAIALSIKRVKEIGVRKAVGAARMQLTTQFMSESLFTLAVAMLVAILVVEIALPVLNPLLQSRITTDYGDPLFLAFLAGIAIVVSFVSGSYLSVYANSYKTASILKGAPRNPRGGFSLQNLLVLAQFSISLILIISSLIISNQLTFLQNKKIGLDYHQVVNVPLYSKPKTEVIQTLKTELTSVPGVVDVAASTFQPGRATWNQTMWWEGQTEEYSMYVLTVDKDFMRTMDIELIEGDAAEIMSAGADGQQYILNESAVKIIGWDHALGKAFSPFGQQRSLPVAGVVRDFNFKSLHHGLEPLVVVVGDKQQHNQISIKVSTEGVPATLERIEAVWKKIIPDVPFEFEFLDDKYQMLYISEIRLGHVVRWLTILSVFFSLMGLYGLLSFNIENRTKEIAIRKALGVSTANLLVLFSSKYFKLLLAGAVIALPLTYMLTSAWLDNFTYKVTPGAASYLLAYGIVFTGLAALILIKSAAFTKINPAVSLKYE